MSVLPLITTGALGFGLGAATLRAVMDIRSRSGSPYRIVQFVGRELKKMDERIVTIAAGIRALPGLVIAANPPVAGAPDPAVIAAAVEAATADLKAQHEEEIELLQKALADATPKAPDGGGGDDDPGQKADAPPAGEVLTPPSETEAKPALFGGFSGQAQEAA